jgi:hypothetical protein
MRVPPAGTSMQRLPRPYAAQREVHPSIVELRARQEHGSGAIAEEDAGPPILPVEDL